MRAKPSIVFLAAAAVLSSCTADPPSRPDPRPAAATSGSAAGDILLLLTGDGVAAVRPPGGSVLFEGAGAVPGPDGSRLYSASRDGGYTALETRDAATGSVLSSTRIRGNLDVRVVSGSGRAVALMEPLPDGLDPWTPVPRSHTTIVVADPTGERRPQHYRLEGNLEPEAFSIGDSRLFLIEYLPAEAPAAYRVTVLELAGGDLHPPLGRFNTPPERMPGIRLRQELDPSGKQVYTLYSSKHPAYAHGAGAWSYGDEVVSFIHVLNLERGWAYCVGLPEEFWDQPAGTQAMATSPDGRHLYVVDSIQGVLSVMDTRTLDILRTEEVEVGSPGSVRTSARVSADGGTLFVGSAGEGSAIDAIDTATFDVLHRWPMHGVVSGLGLSGDGLRLYVALGDRVAVLDPATGEELAAVPVLGVDSILHVGTLGA